MELKTHGSTQYVRMFQVEEMWLNDIDNSDQKEFSRIKKKEVHNIIQKAE